MGGGLALNDPGLIAGKGMMATQMCQITAQYQYIVLLFD